MDTQIDFEETLELEALLISRTYLYTLFHKVFGGYPSKELVEAILSSVTQNTVEEYAEGNATLTGLLGFLRQLSNSDPEDFAQNLSGEYTRMFVGPGRPEVFPYESP